MVAEWHTQLPDSQLSQLLHAAAGAVLILASRRQASGGWVGLCRSLLWQRQKTHGSRQHITTSTLIDQKMVARTLLACLVLALAALAQAQPGGFGGSGGWQPGCRNIIPPPPRDLRVRPVGNGLDVAWDTPYGNPCVDAFQVSVRPVSGGAQEAARRVSSRSTQITGLRPNTAYEVTVQAINRNYPPGVPARAFATTQAAPKPSPSPSPAPPKCNPNIVAVAPFTRATEVGSQSLKLSWDAPKVACVDSYKVEGFDTTTGAKVFSSSVVGTITNVTVPGLKPQTQYRFTVSAVNKAGPSLVGVVNPKTAAAPPTCRESVRPASPVQPVATLNGTDRVQLSWARIEDGVCINDYTITGVDNTGKSVLKASSIYPNITATQLTPGTNVTFTIVSKNKAGESKPITITTSVPKAGPNCNVKPAAPVNFTSVLNGTDRLQLAWANGNPDICVEDWSITGVDSAGKPVLKASTIYPNITATQLTPGTNVTFTITTRNKAGASTPTTFTASVPKAGPNCNVKPAAPVNVTFVPDGLDRLKFSWANGNPDICAEDYTITGVDAAGKPVLKMSSIYPNATATQLKPGNYTFTITTRNKAGESTPLTATGVMPRYGPDGCTDAIPSEIRGFEAKLGGPGELQLNWRGPKNNACVQKYVVSVKETGETFDVTPKSDKDNQAAVLKYKASKPGNAYTFKITPFSAPSGKEGVSYVTPNALPTTGAPGANVTPLIGAATPPTTDAPGKPAAAAPLIGAATTPGAGGAAAAPLIGAATTPGAGGAAAAPLIGAATAPGAGGAAAAPLIGAATAPGAGGAAAAPLTGSAAPLSGVAPLAGAAARP